MKKVLASLVTCYVLTSGQPPAASTTNPGQAAPSTSNPSLTAPGQTTTTTTAAPPAPPIGPVPPVPPVGPVAPVTTTTAPPYNNPYCPMTAGGFTGAMVGSNQACTTNVGPGSIANDVGGHLQCENFGCCLCSEINCGLGATPCYDAYFGDSGAVGAQNINIVGSLVPTPGMFGQQNIGADIDCNGLEGCKNARIMGKNIDSLKCSGDLGCALATIIIDDPVPGMQIGCSGFMGCAQSSIEINIGSPPPPGQTCTGINMPRVIELGQMQFDGQDAAQGATITVNNRGCDMVMIDNLDCPDPDSCVGTQFIFNGNVQIQQCDLYGATVLPAGCLSGNGMTTGLPPQFPPAAAPPVPPVAAPAPPANPAVPAAPVTTAQTNVPAVPGASAAPQTPAAPAPPVPPAPATSTGTNPAPPAGPGAVPAPPAQPVTTLPAAINAGSFPLECRDLFTCANKRLFVDNPPRNWELDCVYTGVCGGLTLDLNFGPNYFVDQIDGLLFREPNAAQGATININAVSPLEISNIHCEEYGACNGLTINLGPGVDLYSNGIDCANPGACFGCTVNQGTMSAPCEAFDNNGNFPPQQLGPVPVAPFNPIGGGQTPQQQVQQQQPQQPVVPQLPQQQGGVPQYQPPTFPQQQQPQQPQQVYPWQI